MRLFVLKVTCLSVMALVLCCVNANAQKGNGKVASDDKINVVIGEAVVNDVVTQGHLSGYMADMLIQQIRMNCPNVRILDKEMLKESQSSKYNPKYQINIVMQKPDVVNESNGSHINASTAYSKRTAVATLRSVVNMSVTVVDYETAAIEFQDLESGMARGKRSVLSEMSVIGFGGGRERNLGIEDYKQSLSGEAIREASTKLAEKLRAWFDGEIDVPALDNTINYVNLNGSQRMFRRGSSLYLGTTKLNKYEAQDVFANYPELYFKYKGGRRISKSAWWVGFGVFTVCIMAGGFILSESSSDVASEAVRFSSLLAATGTIVGLKICGKRKIGNVASQYNEYCGDYSFIQPKARNGSSMTLSLKANGLCLSF